MTLIDIASMSPARQQSTKDCMAAYSACMETEERARSLDDLRVDRQLLRLIRESGELCRLTAEASLHNSESLPAIARAGIEVSRRCAEDLARIGGHSDIKRCADACARAASACGKLARG
ncbi:MAG: hypothetical protein M0D55_00195 [Elusimicrobiota bacterium]|nr:MAG: hypothetical protein M0D55_00195 [Elusimicrobiota bacterium]